MKNAVVGLRSCRAGKRRSLRTAAAVQAGEALAARGGHSLPCRTVLLRGWVQVIRIAPRGNLVARAHIRRRGKRGQARPVHLRAGSGCEGDAAADHEQGGKKLSV